MGSWKFNLQTSRVSNPDNFKDRRQVFEALGPDSWRFTESGWFNGAERTESNVVALDGKEHAWADGTTVSYKRIDSNHAIGTRRRKGRSQSVDVTISKDGKTLTLLVKGDNLNTGNFLDQTEVFDRE
ncbi:MAG TPA: hypothetical protein VK789_19020 [Bryobacteraceae bacterium]|nr:hypothetical protein [Bryobacteraceae bacterium]